MVEIYDEVCELFNQDDHDMVMARIEERKRVELVSSQEFDSRTVDTYQSKSGWITETMTFNGSGNTYSNIYKQGKEVGNG